MSTTLKCIQAQALLSHGNKVRLGLSVCNALTNKFTKLQLTLGQHSVQVSTLQHDRTRAASTPQSFHVWKQIQKASVIKTFLCTSSRWGHTNSPLPTWIRLHGTLTALLTPSVVVITHIKKIPAAHTAFLSKSNSVRLNSWTWTELVCLLYYFSPITIKDQRGNLWNWNARRKAREKEQEQVWLMTKSILTAVIYHNITSLKHSLPLVWT